MAPENSEEVKPPGRDKPAVAKERKVWHPNLTGTEKTILKLLEKGPVLHSNMVQIFGDKTIAMFRMIFISQPIRWNNRNCQVQEAERGGALWYFLEYLSDAPAAAEPEIATPTSQPVAVQSKADREAIDPLDIDWSKNDATIAKQFDCSRERIRQLRLEYYLWSHINWDDTNEEIAKQMGKLLAKAFGKKGNRGCHISRVAMIRGRKDWLKTNQNNFCRPDNFHIHNTDARQKLEKLATETMTLTQIVNAVGRDKEWVEDTMAELGKIPKPKNYPSRWNWDIVTPENWATLTANQIRKLVTDDQGKHPTQQVVVTHRLRLKKSGKI